MIYLIGFVAFVSLGLNIMLIDEILRFKDYVYTTQRIILDIAKDLIDTLESNIPTFKEGQHGD